MLRLSDYRGLMALVAVLSATPVVAQTNFANLTIALGFPPESGMVAGNTGGSYSLPSLVNRDRNNTPCLGYGDETPDHKLVLEQDFPKLSIKVNSGGNDTTLVIKGPNGVALCGDDTGSKKDASVEASNLEAGEYSVWVGSINPGQNWNYTLSVRE